VDGYNVEFSFLANLSADNFVRQIFNIKQQYKILKTNKFETCVLEAN